MAQQKRSLYIKQSQALDILKKKGVLVRETPLESDMFISITVDRTALSPCIVASKGVQSGIAQTRKFPFNYSQTSLGNGTLIAEVASYLNLPVSSHGNLADLVQALWEIFREKEAFVLETHVGTSAAETLEVHAARFGFDDAAFRSSGRQEDIHSLRNTAEEVPEEVEAEKDGIVYVKYVDQLL